MKASQKNKAHLHLLKDGSILSPAKTVKQKELENFFSDTEGTSFKVSYINNLTTNDKLQNAHRQKFIIKKHRSVVG